MGMRLGLLEPQIAPPDDNGPAPAAGE